MEQSYHGFYVGPASSTETASAAIGRTKVASAEIYERRGATWVVLESASEAERLAAALGDGIWVWEVELDNQFADDEGSDGEGHKLTIDGKQWRAGGLQARTRDEFTEDGLIGGGVMAEVGLEYVCEYTRIEALADSEQGGPSSTSPSAVLAPERRPAPENFEGPAALIIDALLERGDLEVVNHHAQRTLIRPVERCLHEPSDALAAAAILQVLEDRDEVVEIYADEAEVEALIAEHR